jgi:hypothetical protein
VEDAPVKQLYKISISNNAGNVFKPGNIGQQIMASAMPDPTKKPDQNFLSSMTGRFACPLYDVVPFNLQIVVDATERGGAPTTR